MKLLKDLNDILDQTSGLYSIGADKLCIIHADKIYKNYPSIPNDLYNKSKNSMGISDMYSIRDLKQLYNIITSEQSIYHLTGFGLFLESIFLIIEKGSIYYVITDDLYRIGGRNKIQTFQLIYKFINNGISLRNTLDIIQL